MAAIERFVAELPGVPDLSAAQRQMMTAATRDRELARQMGLFAMRAAPVSTPVPT